MMFPTIIEPGGRFRLRELVPADLSRLEALDRLVFYAYMRHKVGPIGYLREGRAAQGDRDRHLYYIGIDKDEQLIGAIDVIDLKEGSAEIGYFLHPSFQRRGITTKALVLVIAWLQEHAGLRHVWATADPDNPASVTLLKRLGFTRAAGPPILSEYLGDPADLNHVDSQGILQKRPRIRFDANVSSILASMPAQRALADLPRRPPGPQ